MLDLSTRDTDDRCPPKKQFLYIEKDEDNLSTRDKTAEFILAPKCPLFGGSTVSGTQSRIYMYTFMT